MSAAGFDALLVKKPKPTETMFFPKPQPKPTDIG